MPTFGSAAKIDCFVGETSIAAPPKGLNNASQRCFQEKQGLLRLPFSSHIRISQPLRYRIIR